MCVCVCACVCVFSDSKLLCKLDWLNTADSFFLKS